MFQKLFLAASVLAASVLAQVPGTLTPEVHPSLATQQCTKAGGCVIVNTSIVLDSQYRWMHNVGGHTNCVSTGFNSTLCPDAATCAKSCALEGVDYASYGIHTSGSSLTLNLFKQENNVTTQSSPRVYLLANETTYDMFHLLNKELTFDVDVSQVPCGINGALYLSEMDPTGDSSNLNKAGAKYGTGYCDAQCPVNNFVKGVVSSVLALLTPFSNPFQANLNMTNGACCNEMDIWEANSAATAFTPHPCNATGVLSCQGTQCGRGTGNKYLGVCDSDGCDYNAYRMGNQNFYGPGKVVDTTKPFTVVTQFITSDCTDKGTLSSIKRLYVQGGNVIANAAVNIPGMATQNNIDNAYCASEKKVMGGTDAFTNQGGMSQMGQALSRGMVLIFSIWMDSGSGMQWLDASFPATANATTAGVARGPCSATSGDTAMLTAKYPNAAVTFSNIKVGELQSTFGNSATAPKN
jgi:cellulose 1,4-beta-cellobiosidase